MNSYYDPPEDGPGAITGPDWWVTTYQHNERDEEIICKFPLSQLTRKRNSQWVTIKTLAKEGYEVFIRYGYAWAMEEDADEWLFADSYEDAQGEIGDRHLQEFEDAQERAVDTAMEAKYDRD